MTEQIQVDPVKIVICLRHLLYLMLPQRSDGMSIKYEFFASNYESKDQNILHLAGTTKGIYINFALK